MKGFDYVKSIGEFEKICFPEDFWSEKAIEETLEREDAVCGVKFAAETGKPIGYFLGAASFEEAELYRIAVLPEFRGQGYGKQIMKAFLDSLPRETERVFLEVRESNLAAVGLYERCGFKVIGVRKKYYGDEDGVIFRLEIQSGTAG